MFTKALRTMLGVFGGLMVASVGVAANGPAPVDGFREKTEAWRAERVAELTKADGWLALIGLHFLKPGDNTVGSERGKNDVVLAAGPARLGVANVAADGKVTFVVGAGVEVLGGGRRGA
jgi:uncharacterized protein (DUF1684 family)